jgi:hypothetical protein
MKNQGSNPFPNQRKKLYKKSSNKIPMNIPIKRKNIKRIIK